MGKKNKFMGQQVQKSKYWQVARIGQATDFDTKSKFDTKRAHVNFNCTSLKKPSLMYPNPPYSEKEKTDENTTRKN